MWKWDRFPLPLTTSCLVLVIIIPPVQRFFFVCCASQDKRAKRLSFENLDQLINIKKNSNLVLKRVKHMDVTVSFHSCMI